MRGKPDGGTFDSLPTWFQHCGEKVIPEQYKMSIIRKDIMTKTHYDDADVPLLSPLLNMDIKRNWVGKDSNITHLSLVNATTSIPPFLVLDLT